VGNLKIQNISERPRRATSDSILFCPREILPPVQFGNPENSFGGKKTWVVLVQCYRQLLSGTIEGKWYKIVSGWVKKNEGCYGKGGQKNFCP